MLKLAVQAGTEEFLGCCADNDDACPVLLLAEAEAVVLGLLLALLEMNEGEGEPTIIGEAGEDEVPDCIALLKSMVELMYISIAMLLQKF